MDTYLPTGHAPCLNVHSYGFTQMGNGELFKFLSELTIITDGQSIMTTYLPY